MGTRMVYHVHFRAHCRVGTLPCPTIDRFVPAWQLAAALCNPSNGLTFHRSQIPEIAYLNRNDQ